MAEIGGGGLLGALGGIVAGIGNAISSFFGITAKDLIKFLNYLKEHLLTLTKEMFKGVYRAAKAIAKSVRTLAKLAGRGLKNFAQWAYREVKKLHDYLEKKFKPVLAWLAKLKKHIRELYDKWVKPVVDTIEFIRKLNSILELFHISLLKKLDATLATIERRIEDPFVKLNQWITWAENQIDRIIGLDGIFQRVTLIKSMSRYAPAWLRIATAARSKPLSGEEAFRRAASMRSQDTDELVDQLGAYIDGERNDTGEVVDAAVARLTAFWNA